MIHRALLLVLKDLEVPAQLRKEGAVGRGGQGFGILPLPPGPARVGRLHPGADLLPELRAAQAGAHIGPPAGARMR